MERGIRVGSVAAQRLHGWFLGRAGDGVYTTNGNGHEVAWNNCQRLKANHVKASTSVTQPSTPPLLSGNHPALAAELQPL
jgi:hypothetical protein